MTNKRNRTRTIVIQSAHGLEVGRFVHARRRSRKDRTKETYELIDDALDLGLVSGDVVSCEVSGQGGRYMTGVESLRNGTLGTLSAAGSFCHQHLDEVLEQTIGDWKATGCEVVRPHDSGWLSGFWPASIPVADADMTVARSAAEFGLDGFISALPQRLGYIEFRVDPSPRDAMIDPVLRALRERQGRDRDTGRSAA
ncbi:hypothetical protein [Corynebacterium halotolerans]|uniref:Uncharacterized protein n=1 Tax=Corynebacterium halotolerans YIM 70093 = DSM 44683 TaxID=1121362 RepID=M1NPC6_9CORY|nr:hypothetical protein [Corynebacterium halotolerans]AGF71367.1 hypothetical protein A605_01765 [Corynebacterium halotolerans YIM 70093 = DSM 44683]